MPVHRTLTDLREKQMIIIRLTFTGRVVSEDGYTCLQQCFLKTASYSILRIKLIFRYTYEINSNTFTIKHFYLYSKLLLGCFLSPPQQHNGWGKYKQFRSTEEIRVLNNHAHDKEENLGQRISTKSFHSFLKGWVFIIALSHASTQ